MKRAPELSINERFILQYIIDITSKGKMFYRSDETISNLLDVDKRTVARMFSKMITNGYLMVGEGNKKLIMYTGKEFVRLPIYSNYKSLKANTVIRESKMLKDTITSLQTQNSILMKRIDDLSSKVEYLNGVNKELLEQRDNMIITIEDLNREIQALK
jgi:hypothetical protein